MTAGTEVRRINGGPGYRGNVGTVVEETESRLRVYWHANEHGEFNQNHNKRKRTWVAKTAVVEIK